MFAVDGQYNREFLSGQVTRPEDILITPDGEILIADMWKNRVAIFNTSGDLLHKLDVPLPNGLANATNGKLMVTGHDGVYIIT